MTVNPVEIIMAILATWRITHLLVAENGPFDVIVWIRRKAGSGFWGKLLDCFYCLSVWVAAPVAVLLVGTWKERVLIWLALSAAAILMNRIIDRIAPEQPVFFEGTEPEGRKEEL